MSMIFIEFSGYRVTEKWKSKMWIYKCSFCEKKKEIHVTNSSKVKSCGCMKWIFLRDAKAKKKVFIDKWDYIEFELSKWWLCLVDKQDYEKLKLYSWYKSVRWYVEVRSEKKLIKLHRFLFDSDKIEWMVIDHINQNPLDNRRINLRICTQSQNLMNSWPKKWKIKWVYFDKKVNKFIARCGKKYIWWFISEKDAAFAYNIEAKKQYWEYAFLNIL